MIYRLRCTKCQSYKMLVFKKTIPADGGLNITWDYECADCGAIYDKLEWKPFGS